MVSIIKVSVLLHSPFTPFLSIFSSICFIALTPFSKDTHFVLIGNSHCHFQKNRKCIQRINNVYKSNQVTSTWCMSANKQNLRISNLPYPNSCWTLSSTLDCAPLFLQFSFSLRFVRPPPWGASAESTHSPCFCSANPQPTDIPQIKTSQDQKDDNPPTLFSLRHPLHSTLQALIGGARTEHDIQIMIPFHYISKENACPVTWTSCKCLKAKLEKTFYSSLMSFNMVKDRQKKYMFLLPKDNISLTMHFTRECWLWHYASSGEPIFSPFFNLVVFRPNQSEVQ